MIVSKNDIYWEGKVLRDDLLAEYWGKYVDRSWNVLIHSPSNGAWKYGFRSWLQILEYMGINTTIVYDINNDPFLPEMDFDILITPADLQYRWNSENKAVSRIPHKIGLASKEKVFLTSDKCTGWDARNIEMIKGSGFDFLITSFSRDFINYVLREWVKAGIEIIEVPFGFNPIVYYPEGKEEIDDFFFVGTNSPYKNSETNKFLVPIVSNERYYGKLCGVGWLTTMELLPNEVRGFYSRAKINLNYHIKEQKMIDSEINERTFIISACGGFQLVDNPKALVRFYSTEDMAVANDEKDYLEKFEYFLHEPRMRHEMALNALIKSYKNKYSLFHRIGSILDRINVS